MKNNCLFTFCANIIIYNYCVNITAVHNDVNNDEAFNKS